jgi:hypothetical protein
MIVSVEVQVGLGLFEDKLSAGDTFSGASRGCISLRVVFFSYLFSYFMARRGDDCVDQGVAAVLFFVPSFSEGQGQSWVD